MNKTQQAAQLKAFHEKMEKVICSKREDYANEDVLSNFKLVSQISGVEVEKVMMVFLATKIVRLGELFKKGTAPKNESVDDSIIDLANYSALLEMVRSEKAIVDAPICQQATEDAYCDYCSFARECDRKTCVAFPSTSK
jgi:hypothetical protein